MVPVVEPVSEVIVGPVEPKVEEIVPVEVEAKE